MIYFSQYAFSIIRITLYIMCIWKPFRNFFYKLYFLCTMFLSIFQLNLPAVEKPELEMNMYFILFLFTVVRLTATSYSQHRFILRVIFTRLHFIFFDPRLFSFTCKSQFFLTYNFAFNRKQLITYAGLSYRSEKNFTHRIYLCNFLLLILILYFGGENRFHLDFLEMFTTKL